MVEDKKKNRKFRIRWWWNEDAEQKAKEDPEFAQKLNEKKEEVADALGKDVKELEKPSKEDVEKAEKLVDDGKIKVDEALKAPPTASREEAPDTHNKSERTGGGASKKGDRKDGKGEESKGNNWWSSWGTDKNNKGETQKEGNQNKATEQDRVKNDNANNGVNKEDKKRTTENDLRKEVKEDNGRENSKKNGETEAKKGNDNSWFNWGGKPGDRKAVGDKPDSKTREEDSKAKEPESAKSNNNKERKTQSEQSGKQPDITGTRDKKGKETPTDRYTNDKNQEKNNAISDSEDKANKDSEKAKPDDAARVSKVDQSDKPEEDKEDTEKKNGAGEDRASKGGREVKPEDAARVSKVDQPDKPEEDKKDIEKTDGAGEDKASKCSEEAKPEDAAVMSKENQPGKPEVDKEDTEKKEEDGDNKDKASEDNKGEDNTKNRRTIMLFVGVMNAILVTIFLILTEIVFDCSVRHNILGLFFLGVAVLPFILTGWYKSNGAYFLSLFSTVLTVICLVVLFIFRTKVHFFFVKLEHPDPAKVREIMGYNLDMRNEHLFEIGTEKGVPVLGIVDEIKTKKGVKVLLLGFELLKKLGRTEYASDIGGKFIKTELAANKDKENPVLPAVYSSEWGRTDSERALQDIGKTKFSHFGKNYIIIYGLFELDDISIKKLNRKIYPLET